MIQLQLQLQLLLKIFPQLQLQLQLLDFFFNVIAITITNQLKLNYISSRAQLLYNILVFRGFYLDSIKNQATGWLIDRISADDDIGASW